MAHWIEGQGGWAPLLFVVVFIAASFLMIWRLEAMSAGGVEGTVLGTLIMPYCSGMGNLLLAFVIGRNGGSGADVLTNALVNNVTNMTLLIGLPAVIWGLNLAPAAGRSTKRGKIRQHEIHRLSLLLTLSAVLFFTGAVWALGRRGRLDFNDGLVLVGLFLFWQCFHVFEVLKSNVRQNKSLSWMLALEIGLLGLGAYAQYISIDWLVHWLSRQHTGFLSARNLGWLSGWLMVLPNGVLAWYYAWRRNPEIVYTSQVGDAHVCIPLCIGVFALFRTCPVPPVFQSGMILLIAATLTHMLFIAVLGRLPRWAGVLLVAAYAVFLWGGLSGGG